VLPIEIVRYLEAKLERSIETMLLLASFFVSVGYVGAVTVPDRPSVGSTSTRKVVPTSLPSSSVESITGDSATDCS
jgi:hypothetical protein